MSWRARLLVVAATTLGVLVAAWIYLPDFREGVGILWEDGTKLAEERLAGGG